MDFATFGVTVSLYLLSVVKAIKKHRTSHTSTGKTTSMSSLVFCITYKIFIDIFQITVSIKTDHRAYIFSDIFIVYKNLSNSGIPANCIP